MNEPHSKYRFGALPPKEFEWQLGKTAGSIAFVRSCYQVLVEGSETLKTENEILNFGIEAVKSGKLVVTREFTASQWFEWLRDTGLFDKYKAGEATLEQLLPRFD